MGRRKKINPHKTLSPDYPSIVSYPDPEIKDKFLRETRAILKAAGEILNSEYGGIETLKINVNRAGIAVSGEVTAYYKKPGEEIGVFVEISAGCMGNWYNRTRTDSVELRACTEKFVPHDKGWRTEGTGGANQFAEPAPSMTSKELADWIYWVLKTNRPFAPCLTGLYLVFVPILASPEPQQLQLL